MSTSADLLERLKLEQNASLRLISNIQNQSQAYSLSFCGHLKYPLCLVKRPPSVQSIDSVSASHGSCITYGVEVRMSRKPVRSRQALSLVVACSFILSTITPAASAVGSDGGSFQFTNPTAAGGVAGGERIDLGDLVNDNSTPSSPTAGGDVGSEPGIDLGSLGSRQMTINSSGGGYTSSNIPSGNPYAPWTPYDAYPNGAPGMLAIPETMVPGIICPLVDSRPNPELMTAINQLFNYAIPFKNCRPENANQLAELQARMKQSAEELKVTYGEVNSGVANAGSIDLGKVDANIQNIVTGISSLGQMISKNPLANDPVCGQSDMKHGEIIKAMGNLVTSVAPYALLLASIGSGGVAPAAGAVAATKPLMASLAKPVFKFILGAFAVGTVTNVYSDLLVNGTMDMRKPDQREALRQNLCEYYRIEQRLNFLKLEQLKPSDGPDQRLKLASRKLEEFSRLNNKTLEKKFSPEVIEMAKTESAIALQLQGYQQIVRKDLAELEDIKKIKLPTTSPTVLCSLGKRLVSKAKSESEFPGRALSNYQSILRKQTRITNSQESFVQAELDLRNAIQELAAPGAQPQLADGVCIANAPCRTNQRCASIVTEYVDTLQSIVADSKDRISILHTSMTSQLGQNSEFKEYKTIHNNLKREVVIRQSAGRLLSQFSGRQNKSTSTQLMGDEASSVRSEMDSQMALLKATFFSRPSVASQSPVRAYLEFFQDEYKRVFNAYDQELKGFLRFVVAAATKHGRPETYQDLANMEKARSTLSTVRMRQNSCPRLTSLLLKWDDALHYLYSQKFFCNSISTMLDSRVESQIIGFCRGGINEVTGQVLAPAEVDATYALMMKKHGDMAKLIYQKHRELNCEVPTLPQWPK